MIKPYPVYQDAWQDSESHPPWVLITPLGSGIKKWSKIDLIYY